MIPSFRDGPKDQTRNLEIPGSRFRASRNDAPYSITRARSAASGTKQVSYFPKIRYRFFATRL